MKFLGTLIDGAGYTLNFITENNLKNYYCFDLYYLRDCTFKCRLNNIFERFIIIIMIIIYNFVIYKKKHYSITEFYIPKSCFVFYYLEDGASYSHFLSYRDSLKFHSLK